MAVPVMEPTPPVRRSLEPFDTSGHGCRLAGKLFGQEQPGLLRVHDGIVGEYEGVTFS
jgi:hypothetical protein